MLFSFSGRGDRDDPPAIHQRPRWLRQLGWKILRPHHDRDVTPRQWLRTQSQQSASHLWSRPHLWVWKYLYCQSWKPNRLWDQTGEQPSREKWSHYQASEYLLPLCFSLLTLLIKFNSSGCGCMTWNSVCNCDSCCQECKVQNTIREYCKIFAAEARVSDNFGFSLE